MKKLSRFLAILLAAAIAVTSLSLVSFAEESMEEAAIAIESGEPVTGKLPNRGDRAVYEFTAKSTGTLTVTYYVDTQTSSFFVYDEYGVPQKFETINIKLGEQRNNKNKEECFQIDGVWNSEAKKLSAEVTCNITKGVTYYIMLAESADNVMSHNGGGSYKITANYIEKTPTKEFSYFGITLKKGSTMQLEAVDATEAKWSSSKKTIVSVTSNGKITAKKKGTSIITCTSGGKTVKLKVKVVA